MIDTNPPATVPPFLAAWTGLAVRCSGTLQAAAGSATAIGSSTALGAGLQRLASAGTLPVLQTLQECGSATIACVSQQALSCMQSSTSPVLFVACLLPRSAESRATSTPTRGTALLALASPSTTGQAEASHGTDTPTTALATRSRCCCSHTPTFVCELVPATMLQSCCLAQLPVCRRRNVALEPVPQAIAGHDNAIGKRIRPRASDAAYFICECCIAVEGEACGWSGCRLTPASTNTSSVW